MSGAMYLYRGSPRLAKVNAAIMAEREGKTGAPPPPPEHGTRWGWRKHQRAGEEPCEPCKLARLRYNQERAAEQKERRRAERMAASEREGQQEVGELPEREGRG